MASTGDNFWNRLARVAKANINRFEGELEKPEKVIAQAVEDMQVRLRVPYFLRVSYPYRLFTIFLAVPCVLMIIKHQLQSDLLQIRQAYAEAIADRRRWEQQKEHTDAEADDWYRRADFALRKNQVILARKALERRQILQERSLVFQNQIETLSVATDKLHEAMTALESEIQQAAAKKEHLIARAKAAKLTQVVNDMLNGSLFKRPWILLPEWKPRWKLWKQLLRYRRKWARSPRRAFWNGISVLLNFHRKLTANSKSCSKN
jgi:phage shock protein A